MATREEIRGLGGSPKPTEDEQKAPRGPDIISHRRGGIEAEFKQTLDDVAEAQTRGEAGPQRNLTSGTTWEGGGGYVYKMEDGGIRIVKAPGGQEEAVGFLVDASNPNLKKAYDAIVTEWMSTPAPAPAPTPEPETMDDLVASAASKAWNGRDK